MYSIGVLCALLTHAIQGCAPIPSFPFPGVAILQTSQDFDALKNDPMQFQNLSIQLAGRIRGVETTKKNLTFLAEWLPFPKDTYAGPETRAFPRTNHLFFMHFSGTIDDEGRSQGNEFLLLGQMAGLEDMVTLQGRTRAIPYFNVQCLHIWKTAATDLYEFIRMNPLNNPYPPPLEETYCVPQSTYKN